MKMACKGNDLIISRSVISRQYGFATRNSKLHNVSKTVFKCKFIIVRNLRSLKSQALITTNFFEICGSANQTKLKYETSIYAASGISLWTCASSSFRQ